MSSTLNRHSIHTLRVPISSCLSQHGGCCVYSGASPQPSPQSLGVMSKSLASLQLHLTKHHTLWISLGAGGGRLETSSVENWGDTVVSPSKPLEDCGCPSKSHPNFCLRDRCWLVGCHYGLRLGWLLCFRSWVGSPLDLGGNKIAPSGLYTGGSTQAASP